ncbi:hypothetical protein [Georgenia deserti]|uniref:Antitoxin VbhA domain-containing protein n=1 Tax=Georgenia deserti TaxID=2093781 RepID=A0ABW4L0P8_9MICO
MRRKRSRGPYVAPLPRLRGLSRPEAIEAVRTWSADHEAGSEVRICAEVVLDEIEAFDYADAVAIEKVAALMRRWAEVRG